MLGDIADSSSFAMVTSVVHSFLNSARVLDDYTITFLVDSHVCGQRNNSMFSKRPGEHTALFHSVSHFGKILEEGGSS